MDETKKEHFRRTLREIKNLPTLPGIVTKLTAMAEDPDTSTEQMGKVISKDHILAAKLLRLVNSAFYGFPQRISSLNNAIILLGFNVIKSLIISASIFEIMEDQDVQLGLSDPEEISTAGLIHDIGKVAIKMELPEEFEEINIMVREKKVSRYTAERDILGLDHAEVGRWLAKKWNLPNKLIEPIACHHDPRLAKDEQLASAVVHFGNIVIRGMGYGHGDDIWVPPMSQRAFRLLELSAVDIDEILDEIEEKLWDVKGFSLEIQSEQQAEAADSGCD